MGDRETDMIKRGNFHTNERYYKLGDVPHQPTESARELEKAGLSQEKKYRKYSSVGLDISFWFPCLLKRACHLREYETEDQEGKEVRKKERQDFQQYLEGEEAVNSCDGLKKHPGQADVDRIAKHENATKEYCWNTIALQISFRRGKLKHTYVSRSKITLPIFQL